MTTNCIKFDGTDIEPATGVGSVSTLTFDIDITVEPMTSRANDQRQSDGAHAPCSGALAARRSRRMWRHLEEAEP